MTQKEFDALAARCLAIAAAERSKAAKKDPEFARLDRAHSAAENRARLAKQNAKQ